MLTVLDLFSGIGGISLGLERTGGFRTVAFCECEPYCQQVLRRHWPDVPVYGDIRTLKGGDVGAVDVVTGGFPCQPFSLAGQRKGREDERFLWPEMLRVIRESQPTWIVGENVPGIMSLGVDRILNDLGGEDYTVWPLMVGAADVGAPHRRNRIWFVCHRVGDTTGHRCGGEHEDNVQQESVQGCAGGLADADGNVRQRQTDAQGWRETARTAAGRTGAAVADTRSEGLEGQRARASGTGAEQSIPAGLCGHRWPSRPGEPQHDWEPPRTVPGLGRGAHGLPARLDSRRRRARLKALGNAVVPQVVEAIGRAILAAEEG